MTRILFASVAASLRYPSGAIENFEALFIPIPTHDAPRSASREAAGLPSPNPSPAAVNSRGRA